MSDDDIPRLSVDINPRMSVEDYIVWNVTGAVKSIKENPGDLDTTLMVYGIHKQILTGRGATEEQLATGDRILNEVVKQYTH